MEMLSIIKGEKKKRDKSILCRPAPCPYREKALVVGWEILQNIVVEENWWQQITFIEVLVLQHWPLYLWATLFWPRLIFMLAEQIVKKKSKKHSLPTY